jgi:flavin reductase (DIM6/NTAB) family NADH-FMN oxidoreductase RutF
MVDAQKFRQLWGKFATGVAVVTTIEPDGQVHGMAANGITSVSLEPLLVLVCVEHTRQSYELIKKTRRFAINVLSEDQREVAEYYARPHEKRVEDVEPSFSFTEQGSAILEDCLGSVDCHVVDAHQHGDHTIFIGKVDDIRVAEGKPLIFFDGKMGGLDWGVARR